MDVAEIESSTEDAEGHFKELYMNNGYRINVTWKLGGYRVRASFSLDMAYYLTSIEIDWGNIRYDRSDIGFVGYNSVDLGQGYKIVPYMRVRASFSLGESDLSNSTELDYILYRYFNPRMGIIEYDNKREERRVRAVIRWTMLLFIGVHQLMTNTLLMMHGLLKINLPIQVGVLQIGLL